MARTCSIRKTRPTTGRRIHRRGLAKKKGGVGRHVTKSVKRTFTPNLKARRIWVPELKKFVRVKLSAKAIKTLNRKGALNVLRDAGVL